MDNNQKNYKHLKYNPDLIKNISQKNITGKIVTQPVIVATERYHEIENEAGLLVGSNKKQIESWEKLKIKSILEDYKELYLKNKNKSINQ